MLLIGSVPYQYSHRFFLTAITKHKPPFIQIFILKEQLILKTLLLCNEGILM